MSRILLILLALPIVAIPGFSRENSNSDICFDNGYTYFIRQEYDKALAEFGRFIVTEKRQTDPRADKIAMMHRYRAHCFENLDLFPMAVFSYQEAITIYRQIRDTANMALCLENLSSVFRKQGKPQQALIFLEEALTYFTAVNWLSRIQAIYMETSRILFELNDFLPAREHLFNALKVRKNSEFSFEYTYIEAEVFFLLGCMATREGNYRTATDMLSKADSVCETYVKNLSEKRSLLLKIKLAQAENYRLAGNPDKSASFTNLAFQLSTLPSLSSMNPLVMLEKARFAEDWGNIEEAENILTELLTPPGNAFSGSLFQNQEMKRLLTLELVRICDSRYKKSGDMALLLRKLELLENLFRDSGPSEMSFSLFNDFVWNSEESGRLTGQLVGSAADAYKATGDIRYFRKAFFYSELGYLEMLKSNQQNSIQLHPDDQITRELIALASLKSQINRQLTKGVAGNGTSREDKRKMLHLIEETEKLQNKLTGKSFTADRKPEIFNEQLASQLSARLTPDQVYLKYTDTGTGIMVFSVTKADFTLRSIEKSPDLLKNLEIFKEFIQDTDPAATDIRRLREFTHAAHALYIAFIQPFEPIIAGKEMIIEANGILNSVSFEALLTTDPVPGTLSFRHLPYLLRRYNIRSSNSAGFYLKSYDTGDCKPNPAYAGYAPFSGIAGRKDLPGSEREIQIIAGIMGGKAKFGKSVSKESILQMAGKAGILHLATHARVNDYYPQLTELVINQNPADNENDGRLFYYEIINNTWNQQLVVLGACGSASGKYVVNYGTISLANAFLAAGAKSIVAARWKVDDFSSAKILSDFFLQVKEGKEFGASIREAKILFLDSSPELFQHPHFWAVYSYVGSRQQLELTPGKDWLYLVISALFLVIPGYFLLKRCYFRSVNS